MRRVQHIAAHVHGGEVDSPLWARLMDSNGRPAPRGGGCRCTAEKWRYVCRCYNCLEHAGRAGDFEWTTDLMPPLLPKPAPRGAGLAAQALQGKDVNEELGTTTLRNGMTHHTSFDGRVVGQVSPAVHPRFSGIATFARLPQLHELEAHRPGSQIDIAIVGVPFDSGCSYRPGARFGPEAIRSSSRLIRPYMIAAQQRPLIDRQVVDAGDVAVTPFNIAQATTQIYEGCREKLMAARRLVVIGGDHTLSYPSIKAVAEKFGPVVLVHFDSHLDTFPPMYNQDVWHGSPFRCCWDEGLLAKDGSTHVGIRATTYSVADFADSDKMGITTITAEDVHDLGVDECVKKVRSRYFDLGAGAPVYLSIDIDVLDPSVAPGTGTPEFGGLLAHQLLKFVRGLKGLPIVGADVVEVAPAYDHAGITAMAAASLVLEEIALMNSCMDVDGF